MWCDENWVYLCSWFSNNPILNSIFSVDGRGIGNNSEFQKVLGYFYDPMSDTLSTVPIKPLEGKFTKRNVLSVISTLYDPLGFTNPVVITGKLFLRTHMGIKSWLGYWIGYGTS